MQHPWCIRSWQNLPLSTLWCCQCPDLLRCYDSGIGDEPRPCRPPEPLTAYRPGLEPPRDLLPIVGPHPGRPCCIPPGRFHSWPSMKKLARLVLVSLQSPGSHPGGCLLLLVSLGALRRPIFLSGLAASPPPLHGPYQDATLAARARRIRAPGHSRRFAVDSRRGRTLPRNRGFSLKRALP